jgi:transcriptional antiterminator RfaH
VGWNGRLRSACLAETCGRSFSDYSVDALKLTAMAENWYALQSKPNKEEMLARQLALRGDETFYPRIRVKAVNPRARKVKPYFPGYLFVRTDLERTGASTFRYIPGAAGLIMFGGEAAHVPDGLIQAIRQRVEAGNAGEAEACKPGATVIIQSGPFAGYEAIFNARLPGTERAHVLLKLLGNRQVPVDLPLGQIHPNNGPIC